MNNMKTTILVLSTLIAGGLTGSVLADNYQPNMQTLATACSTYLLMPEAQFEAQLTTDNASSIASALSPCLQNNICDQNQFFSNSNIPNCAYALSTYYNESVAIANGASVTSPTSLSSTSSPNFGSMVPSSSAPAAGNNFSSSSAGTNSTSSQSTQNLPSTKTTTSTSSATSNSGNASSTSTNSNTSSGIKWF